MCNDDFPAATEISRRLDRTACRLLTATVEVS
jgi:hypothetical protein